MPVDRVVEPELALADELEDDGRREGLGHARDLEVVVRSHRRLASDVSQSCRQDRRAVAVADEEDRAGRTGSDERIEVVLEAGRRVDIRVAVSAGADAATTATAARQARIAPGSVRRIMVFSFR